MIYVLQTESGMEMNIRAKLLRENISAYVPRRELILRKSAGWTKVVNLLFPGYVFLEFDYTPELYHKIKPIDGVVRFLGAPSPIRAAEEEFMRLLFNSGEVIPQSEAEVDSSGKVTVTGGWLLGKEQYITKFNVRQKKASAVITFGGIKHRINFGVDYIRK
ncbi:MAG: transcription termination/antitermination NusG family protein [Oscillospiraceae bacterium]